MLKNIAQEENSQGKKGSWFRSFFNVVVGDYDIFFVNIIKFLPLSALFICLCLLLQSFFMWAISVDVVGEIASLILLGFLALLLIVISGVFMQKWYNVVFKGEELRKFNINMKKQAKITGMILIFLSTLGFPIFSVLKLYSRVPTPDWKFELAYFTFFAILALMPFVAIKFSAWFAFLMNDEKLPGVKETFSATSSKMRTMVFAYVVMLILPLIIETNAFNADDYITSVLRCFGWSVFLALFVAEAQIQKCEYFSKKQ